MHAITSVHCFRDEIADAAEKSVRRKAQRYGEDGGSAGMSEDAFQPNFFCKRMLVSSGCHISCYVWFMVYRCCLVSLLFLCRASVIFWCASGTGRHDIVSAHASQRITAANRSRDGRSWSANRQPGHAVWRTELRCVFCGSDGFVIWGKLTACTFTSNIINVTVLRFSINDDVIWKRGREYVKPILFTFSIIRPPGGR